MHIFGQTKKPPCNPRAKHLQTASDARAWRNRFRLNPLGSIFVPQPLRFAPGYPCCCYGGECPFGSHIKTCTITGYYSAAISGFTGDCSIYNDTFIVSCSDGWPQADPVCPYMRWLMAEFVDISTKIFIGTLYRVISGYRTFVAITQSSVSIPLCDYGHAEFFFVSTTAACDIDNTAMSTWVNPGCTGTPVCTLDLIW